MIGSDLGFCPLTLPERASGVIPLCEASGTRSLRPFWAAVEPRGGIATANIKAVEGWVDGMANTCEPSFTAATFCKRKMLCRKAKRLTKRYASRSRGAMEPCRRQCARRRYRRGLTHRGTCAERGKPALLPQGKASRKASRRECGYGIAEKANAVL